MKTPYRYQSAEWAHVPEKLQKLLEATRETRRGIYIHGDVGTGKTHIAWAMANHASEALKLHVVFWNTAELLADIRDDFNQSDPYNRKHTEKHVLDFKGLLFLDDIGAEKLTDWVAERFYLLVNKRYEQGLPTIFTSNLPLSGLADHLGERTTSRIAGMCDLYQLTGDDRRIADARSRK